MHSLSLPILHSVNRCGPPTVCQHCSGHTAENTGQPSQGSRAWCPPRSPCIQHALHSVLDCSITSSRTVLLSPHPDSKFVSKTTFFHLFIYPSPLLQQAPWQHWGCTRYFKDNSRNVHSPARCSASCSTGSAAGSPKCSNLNDFWATTEDSVCSQ